MLPVDLVWSAPAECPSRDAVLQEIFRVVGASSASVKRPGQASARAEVGRDDGGRWRAVLTIDTPDGHAERQLEADNCQAVASAAALIIAVAVEGGSPPPSVLAPGAAAPEGKDHPRPAESPALPSATPQRSLPAASQLVAAAAAILDSATMPWVAPGVEASLGWARSWKAWRVRGLATGSYFPPQTTNPVGSGQQQGSFWLGAAAARACATRFWARVDAGACLGGEFDVMSATATSSSSPSLFDSTPKTGQWWSALGSLTTSLEVAPRVSLFVRGDGVLPLAPHPRFVITQGPGQILVHRPSPSVRGALGVEMRFF